MQAEDIKGAARYILRKPLVLAGLGIVSIVGVSSAISSLSWWMGAPERERVAQEKKRKEFCRSVYESVTPQDKICGSYLPELTREIQEEKSRIIREEKEAKEKGVAANDPKRTLTSSEMWACEEVIKDNLKDPRSYLRNSRNPNRGGWIDYTATNSFGGPVRTIYQCTTGLSVTQ
jgi:hypothetical protein